MQLYAGYPIQSNPIQYVLTGMQGVYIVY